ncbi:NAD-dependent succinate-semialdehyde dehydrogenase [Nesterenkonia flava]|uniref:NAD-dependent succinate-semialdehyde dehydrogenase n=1 Tax=Nesterenkonia flava TaxID=469799 RepID=A0ABU1FWK8_9MICC|nr:NAD-dependent succinate-semialdehyde dehydrogenase [Nesterenkonia flava]MDR5713076.1 NAD-dependent succinate-semialdehyde dehydrogenase [Nesterenkonia flava]
MTSYEQVIESVPKGAYVDGAWTPVNGDASFEVSDPGNGTALCRVADTGEREWDAAVDAASAAFSEWKLTNTELRADLLRRVYDAVMDQAEDIAQIISAEAGKPLTEARAEVRYGASFIRWYSELVLADRGDFAASPSGEYWMVTKKEPVGVALLITPWNFPFSMVTRKLAAAFAAGCTSIIKPAGFTPLSSSWLVKIFHEVGVPAGVVNLLPTTKSAAMSSRLLKDSRVRKVSFTGSTPVGASLLKGAADNILASSMELGGNAPFMVLSDADLDQAVAGALVAKFRNAGQACVGANRIIVHTAVFDEFVEKFVAAVQQLKVGHALEDGVEIGPMISEKQRVETHRFVERGVEEGGRLLTGGEPIEGAGYFYQPTVIVDAPVGGHLWSNELFGPIAAVYRTNSDDEMIELANRTEYGLVAYLYGQDGKRTMRIADGIESGMVAINRPIISEARAPFGGVKASGLGREGGVDGLNDYQVTKYIAIQR